MALRYPTDKLRSFQGSYVKPGSLTDLSRSVARALRRRRGPGALNEWSFGLWCLAAMRADEAQPEEGHLENLKSWLGALIDEDGNWRTPQRNSDQFLKGYSLLYVAGRDEDERWGAAAQALMTSLVKECNTVQDGSIPYTDSTQLVLVDTLGMICPFLAKAGVSFEEPAIIDKAVLQIENFAKYATEPQTGLPYHGYFAGGPYRLGPYGWGRGTGWMLIGLVDTLAALPRDHSAVPGLKALLDKLVVSARDLQKPDGHWAWILPMTDEKSDASATAFIAYALIRARQHDLTGGETDETLKRAALALTKSKLKSGLYTGGSGECLGVNKYARNFGPSHWLQAMSGAFMTIESAHYVT